MRQIIIFSVLTFVVKSNSLSSNSRTAPIVVGTTGNVNQIAEQNANLQNQMKNSFNNNNVRRRDPIGATNCAINEVYGYGNDRSCSGLGVNVFSEPKGYGCMCKTGFVRSVRGGACILESECCGNRVGEIYTYGHKQTEKTCENVQNVNNFDQNNVKLTNAPK